MASLHRRPRICPIPVAMKQSNVNVRPNIACCTGHVFLNFSEKSTDRLQRHPTERLLYIVNGSRNLLLHGNMQLRARNININHISKQSTVKSLVGPTCLTMQARSYASRPSSAEQNRQKTVIGYSLCMVRLPSSSSVRGATAGRDVPEAGRSFRRYSRPHSFPDETQVRLLGKMKSCCFIVSELIRH